MALTQGPSALRSLPGTSDYCIRNQRDSTYRLLCDLKFRFRTQTIMWLEVLQFRFHTWTILWLEVPQFRFRTRNILCLEVQQFCFRKQTICDLKFLSFAQYTVTWISAVPLPQEKTSFEIPHVCFCTRTLLFFGKSTLIQPPTHFLIFVLTYMTDGPSEGQRNKGIGMLLAKVVVNVWLREDL